MQFVVTVATTDGEVVEQFTTADIQVSHRWPRVEAALRNAAELADLGMNEWEEED